MSFFRGISGFGVLDPCSRPGVSQTLGFSIYRVTMRNHLHGFALHRFFARISARIFCTDFLQRCLHGVFAWIFCTYFCAPFLQGFFARIFVQGFCARIFVKICSRILCTDFLGCPKPLVGKRQNFTEKIQPKNSPSLGAFWGGALEAGG